MSREELPCKGVCFAQERLVLTPRSGNSDSRNRIQIPRNAPSFAVLTGTTSIADLAFYSSSLIRKVTPFNLL